MSLQTTDYRLQRGQALVLVLLSLAVVLTIVLFILSRSITDVAVSSRQEESVRAFSAAEAGIEKSLVIGAGTSQDFGTANYSSAVSNYAEGTQDFLYPINMSSGDTFTTWFSNHDTDGNMICDGSHPCFNSSAASGSNFIRICWGKPGTGAGDETTPAVELSFFYEAIPGNVSTINITRGVFDPFVGRRSTNGFFANDSGSCTISGTDYAFSKTLTFADADIPVSSYGVSGGLQFMRARMFYNTDQSHPIGVTVAFAGNSVLPSQGQSITSTGVSGESNRKLEVFQGWPEVPSVFDYAVYSSNGLTQ
ncbi:MAG TPA: hypothetical protein VFI61_01005 [Patescibacteria group bacterium]|nr:hypothetical protein [Patescibacteria group bacterium]